MLADENLWFVVGKLSECVIKRHKQKLKRICC